MENYDEIFDNGIQTNPDTCVVPLCNCTATKILPIGRICTAIYHFRVYICASVKKLNRNSPNAIHAVMFFACVRQLLVSYA